MTATLSSKGRVLPKIIGHRGVCGYAPENTLASFKKASELGVKWVEFDAKLIASGDVIVFHDDTLDRTTSGSGDVARADLSLVRSLDAGSWFGEEFRGEPVPTLIETMQVLADLGLAANVEIKPSPGMERQTAEATCDVIRDHWPGGLPPPVISSFKDDCIAVACDRLPHIERALLIEDDVTNWRARVERLSCCAVHIWHELLSIEVMQEFHEFGVSVRSFTINDRALAAQLFDWGLESICTDFPDRFAGL